MSYTLVRPDKFENTTSNRRSYVSRPKVSVCSTPAIEWASVVLMPVRFRLGRWMDAKQAVRKSEVGCEPNQYRIRKRNERLAVCDHCFADNSNHMKRGLMLAIRANSRHPHQLVKGMPRGRMFLRTYSQSSMLTLKIVLVVMTVLLYLFVRFRIQVGTSS